MATPKRMRAKSIGHYILGKTIGEGTFGKVKLGTHILTGEKVAVKILEKERIVDVADVERVAREIHILKLIQHPHVIQLYEIIETPRQLYLIMEYCSGGELFDHIVASGRVREREACRFFHQILAGVEQIHRTNVVHRDLKPENLLLDDHRNIKIVDFGLSNTFQDGQLLKTACGSPCYAAPEMIAGQRYVPSRCDLWSCGVILFALVCGYLPFEDQNTAALYRKILNAEYQAPKFISESARDLIAGMLTTDPEQRATVSRIRAHPWYRQVSEAAIVSGEKGDPVLEEDVLEQLDRCGFPRDYAAKCLQMNKHNHVTTTYYLLVEKKRRMSDRLLVQPHELGLPAELGGGGLPQSARGQSGGPPPELELPSEALSLNPSPCPAGDAVRSGKPSIDIPMTPTAAPDGDHAGGGSPTPPGQSSRIPAAHVHQNSNSVSPSHWAQVLGQPQYGVNGLPSPRDQQMQQQGSGSVATSHSARGTVPRRHSDNSSTPRGGAVPVGSASQPTPRKRAPIQPALGATTPRGPVMPVTPLSQSATPSRAGTYGVASGGSSSARTSTPGKRPPPGQGPGSVPGESMSARGGPRPSSQATSARAQAEKPLTSANGAEPARPSGSATARSHHANEARRRQYAPASDGGPGSARSARQGGVSPLNVGAGADFRDARAESRLSDIGGPVGVRHPGSAWTGSAGHQNGSVRAASASPEFASSSIDAGVMSSLSAREGREGGQPNGSNDAAAMRTCRGAFNVSCTSSKAPKQILQEIQRALTQQRVSYKQANPFLVKCQKQHLRFEVEISNLDHLESVYVVRFRRVAGDLVPYKELSSKILAEMKI